MEGKEIDTSDLDFHRGDYDYDREWESIKPRKPGLYGAGK